MSYKTSKCGYFLQIFIHMRIICVNKRIKQLMNYYLSQENLLLIFGNFWYPLKKIAKKCHQKQPMIKLRLKKIHIDLISTEFTVSQTSSVPSSWNKSKKIFYINIKLSNKNILFFYLFWITIFKMGLYRYWETNSVILKLFRKLCKFRSLKTLSHTL